MVKLRSIWITLSVSLHCLTMLYSGRLTRQKVDSSLRRWSSKLFHYIKASFSVNNADVLKELKGKPVIFMSNHASLYDIPLTFNALPGSIRMLTKKELFSVPIWGRAMLRSEFIPIDRKNFKKAIDDLNYAKEKLLSGIQLWVYPEGTRSLDGRLGKFKKGGFHLALDTDALIVPVALQGTYDIMPPKSKAIALNRHMQITVGEPIETSSYSKDTLPNLMQTVHQRIEQLMQ